MINITVKALSTWQFSFRELGVTHLGRYTSVQNVPYK